MSCVAEIAEIGFGALGVVETPSKVNAGGFQLIMIMIMIIFLSKLSKISAIIFINYAFLGVFQNDPS